MALPGLEAALQRRRQYVNQVAEETDGEGTGEMMAGGDAMSPKFGGIHFVDKSPTGFVGLINQGATCYLNSFLQMLFMTVDFRKALFGAFLPGYQREQAGQSPSCGRSNCSRERI